MFAHTAQHYMKASLFPLTTEDIRADVGRTSSLVFQQVILTHQVLSQAEVCDGNPVSPGSTHTNSRLCKYNTCVMCLRYEM